MPDALGYSVYLTSFKSRRKQLESAAGLGAPVFLSLHISEEFDPDYCRHAEEMCRSLSELGFKIIADVSVKTVDRFGEPDLVRLAERLGIWALRLDYGFSDDEIAAIAARIPVALNASTTSRAKAERIANGAIQAFAMHNFYPRPETGLDDAFFRRTTEELRAAGLRVLAFIPGDEELRGPVFESLPTLERHRGLPPSACFADLCINFGVDGIFVGDPGISHREQARIRRFCEEGVLEIPADLSEEFRSLYGMVFTSRQDSPSWLVRFAESRTYSCFGERVTALNCRERLRGSITVDNEGYGRYSGEVQIIRSSLPADNRVNVIGQVKNQYLLSADCILNGARFVLVPD